MNIPTNLTLKNWHDLEPFYQTLLQTTLTPTSLPAWLHQASELEKYVWEARAGFKQARSRNIEDEHARLAYQQFTDQVFTPFQQTSHALQAKLLREMTWQPAPEQTAMIHRFQHAASTYHAENAPLEQEIAKLTDRYLLARNAILRQSDAATPPGSSPEQRWLIQQTHWREARAPIDEIFLTMRSLRQQLARQSGFPTYTLYRWQQLNRTEYTPDDALTFHYTLASSFLPAKTAWQQIHVSNRPRQPWQLDQPPLNLLRPLPFHATTDFIAAMSHVFSHLDPEMGALFEHMRAGFLDVDARVSQLPGSEEWFFPISKIPCVRVFSHNTDEDIALLMHECGHAWHDYLAYTHQDLIWQCDYPDEFAEFAAIAMTYLATPFLFQDHGGFYPSSERERFQSFLLYEPLRWLPHIARYDVFQHWLYTEAPATLDPQQLDAKWLELSQQFEPGINWSAHQQQCAHGWQQDARIFSQPFYMLEYALAHVGALQLYQQASIDPHATWQHYHHALTLGGTQPLSHLFQSAGIDFPLNPSVIQHVVTFLTPL